MYVSGELKEKTINFFKKDIINFDIEEIKTIRLNISYHGEITSPPWENNYVAKLKKRQEELITAKEENIKLFVKLKFPLINLEIHRLLLTILQTSRKYTFSLLECFYQLIMNANSIDALMEKLKEFAKLIYYIDSKEYDQIDLPIVLELFLKGKDYSEDSLRKRKSEKFHLNEDEILTESLREIATFGEFASPNRVPKIANTLMEEIETSQLIAPIYFAIPDELTANKFLKLCRNPQIEEEQIKKNATLLRIPKNIQNLIRR